MESKLRPMKGRFENHRPLNEMKTKFIILLAAVAMAGCTTYRGGTGLDNDTAYGQGASLPPTDFGRGGNRANPPPFDTESGAALPETDNMDLHGMSTDRFPPAPR